MKINYPKLPVLGVFFTRGHDLFGNIIAAVTKGTCTHAGFITDDHGQKFATEEKPRGGLQENSLEQYTKPRNHIVSVLYWTGWNLDGNKESALRYLAEIRRRANEPQAKYDFNGLFSFVFPWVKPDKKKQWCSENVLSVLDKFGFGSGWNGRPPSPEQLLNVMKKHNETMEIKDYYL